jgi:hypothetical protein
VDEALQRFSDDQFGPLVAVAVCTPIVAASEWVRWATGAQPHPIMVSVIALVVVAFTILRARRLRRLAASLRLGRDGERQVGAMLEELRGNGCTVIHDVACDGFNLDHVVLSTRGLFCIETKTLSKLPSAPKARYDGQRLFLPGIGDYSHALAQAQRNAETLGRLCRDLTGRSYPVRPVVTFPGWFIEGPEQPWKPAVWAMNPKVVCAMIRGAPEKISSDDVRALIHHLRQHIANDGRRVEAWLVTGG